MKSVTSRILVLLLLICVTASLFSIVFHMLSGGEYITETAIYSQENDSVFFKAVYVRNEEIKRYNGEGVVCYAIPDGGKLGKGSVIADIYADEGQIDLKQELSELDEQMKLVDKIQNPGTIESAQPANLSEQINQKYINIINAREKGRIENIPKSADELIVLLSTYQLVTDKSANFSKRINDIKTKSAQLKAAETVPLDSIVSDKSAYFVSYADGYEETLSMDKLSSITPELIEKIKDKGIVEDKQIIGKLISGYEWYAVGVINNSDTHFSIDENVKLKFQSASEAIDGTVYDIRDTQKSGQSIVVVKCSDITYELVQHRTEPVEMIKGGGEHEGIKVSRRAIRFNDGDKGVYVKLGEQINFKKLDVIYEGDNFVLSSLHAGNGYLSLYDDIVVEGVDADEN